MAKDSDKTKKKLSKKHEDISDSDSDSEYNHIEDITRENMHLPAKDINRMILDIFPLKSKEEKMKQLEKIKEFKKNEKKNKMKKKKSKSKKHEISNKVTKPSVEGKSLKLRNLSLKKRIGYDYHTKGRGLKLMLRIVLTFVLL